MEPNKKQFGNFNKGEAEWEKFLMSVKPGQPTPAPEGGVYRARKNSKIAAGRLTSEYKQIQGFAGPKDRWEAINPDSGQIFAAKSKKAAVRKARKNK